MMENPYFHRTPIRDSRFFFGRTTDTRKILTCVARKQPVSVVGPRRIGKTSLLFHLCDPQVKAAHRVSDNCVFVYIDCQVLSEDLTKSDVYHELLENVTGAMPGDHSAEYSPHETMAYSDFRKRLGEITVPGLQIVLLLDEFEKIADNHQLGRDFFDELRGLGQTGKVVYVTASSMRLADLSFQDRSAISSPFFNPFSTVWLGFLEPHEARALIDDLAATAGFEGFDENDHAFLQDIAGLHPFYLQVACSLLFEEKTRTIGSAVPNYERVKRDFAGEMRGHFEYIWNHLDEDERRTLGLIGEGRLDTVVPEDEERLDQECLVYKGSIFSSAFAEFVKSRMVQPMKTTDTASVVVHRLNEVLDHLNWQMLQRQSLAVIGSDSELKHRLLREVVTPSEDSVYFLFGREGSFRLVKTDKCLTEEEVRKIISSYIFGARQAFDAFRNMLIDSQRALLEGYDGDFDKDAILKSVSGQPQTTPDTLLIMSDRFDEVFEVSYLPELFVPGTVTFVPIDGGQSLDLVVLRICECAESTSNEQVIFVFDDPNSAQLSVISTLGRFSRVTFWVLSSNYAAIRDYVAYVRNFILLKSFFVQPTLDALEKDLGIPKTMVEGLHSSCFVALGNFSSQLPLRICLEEDA